MERFGFEDDFVSNKTRDGRNVILLEPLVYVSKAGERITIPVDATSDGASTPAALWPVIPPFGEYWKAAVLHDYLYRCTHRPKDECDALLDEAMESCGVPEATRKAIFEGVHFGGASSFDDDRCQLALRELVDKVPENPCPAI